MRRTILALLAAAACLLGPACKRQPQTRADATQEEPPPLATLVHMADPKSAAQLLKGFHTVEQNSWRWTMGQFSLLLRPPAGASHNGATLQVKLSIPEAVTQKLGKLTLTATVNGVALPPETYAKPGEHVFSRDVPASALATPSARVDFALDKFLAAGQVDQRELGIVVTTIGFEPK